VLASPIETSHGLVPVQVRNSLGTSGAYWFATDAAASFQFSAAPTSYAADPTPTEATSPACIGCERHFSARRPRGRRPSFYSHRLWRYPCAIGTAQVPSALPLARPEDSRVRIGGLDDACVRRLISQASTSSTWWFPVETEIRPIAELRVC